MDGNKYYFVLLDYVKRQKDAQHLKYLFHFNARNFIDNLLQYIEP